MIPPRSARVRLENMPATFTELFPETARNKLDTQRIDYGSKFNSIRIKQRAAGGGINLL